LKPGDEVEVGVLMNALATYVQTERMRERFVALKLVAMTTRTVVPQDRVKQVQRDSAAILASYIPGGPEAIHVENNVLHPTLKQQAGMRALAIEVAGQPLGNIVPPQFLEGGTIVQLPVEAWNMLVEAVIDTRAGVGARRSAKAEAVPPSIGYALWRALSSSGKAQRDYGKTSAVAKGAAVGAAVGLVAAGVPDLGAAWAGGLPGGIGAALLHHQDVLKRWLVVEEPLGGYPDPHVRELFVAADNNIRSVGSRLLRMIAAFAKDNKATMGLGRTEAFKAVADHLVKQFLPPVDPNKIHIVKDMLGALHGEDVTVNWVLDNRGDMYRALGDMTPDERRAMAGLEEISMHREQNNRGGALMDAEVDVGWDVDQMGHIIEVLVEGLERRMAAVKDHANLFVVGLEGSTRTAGEAGTPRSTSGVLSGLSPAQGERVYTSFYTGQWEDLVEFLGDIGRDTGLGKNRRPTYDFGTAIMTLLANLMAREELNKFHERLVLYNIKGSKVDMFSGIDLIEHGLTREDFMGSVLHYLNTEVQWESGDVYNDLGGVRRMAPRPQDKGVPARQVPGVPGASRGHDFLAFKVAHEILDSYGYERAKGNWAEYTFPDGSTTLMPQVAIEMLERAVNDAADLGAARGARVDSVLDRRASTQQRTGLLQYTDTSPVKGPTRTPKALKEMAQAEAMDTLFSWIPDASAMIRAGVTVGPLVPNPIYFVTNAFGAVLQTYQKTGAAGVLSAGFGNPRLTTAVTARLWG
ncbi:MAG TPA: hypothetical protein VMZ50_09120, partial [Phycisphaerae bacterium]|nr:hypothetical protein [Phycisphaerae bacterium]